MSRRTNPPGHTIASTPSYARFAASAMSSPTATTPSTLPPALTISPSAFEAVPAWNTFTPGSASASSRPSMTSPLAYDPGYPFAATTTFIATSSLHSSFSEPSNAPALALRVAEPHVVLEKLHVVAFDHQPREDDARERAPLRGHPVHGGLHDGLHHLRLHLRREHGRGRVRAHPAGVQPGVALADALVILRAHERDRDAAADDREEARLLAGEKLLDDDLVPGGAERGVEHHVVHRRERGVEVHGDDDALPRGEAVRLHDDRRALALDVRLGLLRVREAFVLRRGDVVLLEEVLEEALRSLQTRRGLGRAEARDLCRRERVREAVHERRLRADDDQADALLLAELHDRGVIGLVHANDLDAVLARDPGVPRGAEQVSARRGLPQTPAQRVLATAAADDEDVRLRVP
eukprot:21121-Pelagococcus_subviridis.AAC.11